MSRFFRVAAVLLFGAWLAACSSTPKENEPAELTDFPREREIQRVWSRGIGDGQGNSYNRLVPAADGDRVYAASADGEVVALRVRNGKVIWKKELDLPLSGGVGLGDGRLLLGSAEGDVLALEPETGEELWRARLTGEVLAPPKGDGDMVVVQTYDGHIVALDAATGEQRWSYAATVPRLTLRGTGTPRVVGRMVIAGLANGRVIALDQESGALRWEQRVSVPQGSTEIERLSDVDGNLLIENGRVYAVGYQGKVMAIDARSGRRLWERDASSYVGPVGGYGNIYVVTEDGSLTAYQDSGQGVIWSQTILANRRLTEPAILSGSIAVADFEGYVHFISQIDGHLVARTRTDSNGVRAPLLVHGKMLFVYGNSGELTALRFESDDEDRLPYGRGPSVGPRR